MNCRKCGLPIAFKKLPSGKFCPTNPDGSDHWDLCKGVDRTFEVAVARAIREGAAKTYAPMQGQQYFYTGDIPPWDESLGAFRDFTPEEIAEGKVCQRLTSAHQRPTEFTNTQLTAKWREIVP